MSDQTKGLALAVSSSVFIGASFVVKKLGLRKAGSTGLRAGAGGYSYLKEPTWWVGMITMIVGEVSNFAAYAYSPAILVTPLGALSIIVSAVLANLVLKERLSPFGVLGCILCVLGSFTIVLHAPEELPIRSVQHIAALALQQGFLAYVFVAVGTSLFLIFVVAPEHGSTNLTVYVAICSILGSLSVMSCKALGLALKLTFEGNNQMWYPTTHYCIIIVAVCVMTQMNYLNKALDLFNTAIVTPVYYVMFTVCTIIASMILFQSDQTSIEIATETLGFLTIIVGVFLLQTTKDLDITWKDLLSLAQRAQGAGAAQRLSAAGRSSSVLDGVDIELSAMRDNRGFQS